MISGTTRHKSEFVGQSLSESAVLLNNFLGAGKRCIRSCLPFKGRIKVGMGLVMPTTHPSSPTALSLKERELYGLPEDELALLKKLWSGTMSHYFAAAINRRIPTLLR
jgi:hypothetical protein